MRPLFQNHADNLGIEQGEAAAEANKIVALVRAGTLIMHG
jgi:hypothetical protein